MQMLIEQVKGAAQDGMVGVETVTHIGHSLMKSDTSLMSLYNKHSADCVVLFERLKNEKPIDYFAHVIMEPLMPMMAEKTNKIPPKALPRIMGAFQMILGMDRWGLYLQRANNRAIALRGSSLNFNWAAFFQDRSVAATLLSAQVAIARSFDKFGNRMNWFITIVNREPPAQPGSDADKAAEERLEVTFKKDDFIKLMYAFFGNVRPESFDEAAREAFYDKYDAFPETVFGPIFADLINAQQSDFYEPTEEDDTPKPAPLAADDHHEETNEPKKKKGVFGLFG